MTRRTSPEIAIFGSVISIRLPWLIAIAFTLGLTAFQLAPNHQVDNHTIVWYINSFVLVCVSVGAVLFHESAHALMARRFDGRVERISIYPLGGVTEDYSDPGTPLQDATIAIAGPLASMLLAAVLFIVWWSIAAQKSMLSNDLFFVVAVNLVLAVANLLPGYPLDGGRIFRALVWYLHDDYSVGTRAAVAYGQVISTFALAVGLVIIGSRNSWSAAGLWVILAAWSVTRVGRQELTRSVLISYGTMLTAGEAVQGINPHVRGDQTLDDVIELLLADVRSGPALVTEGTVVIGVVSLAELRRYRRGDWLTVRARDAMIPVATLPVLDESASIRTLLREFADDRIDTLIISGSDGVVGAIDRRIAVEKLINKVRGARRFK